MYIFDKEKIKQIRKDADQTQEQFAKTLSTNQQSITDIESGRKLPSFEFIDLLHKKYGVNANWLISNSGTKKITKSDISSSEPKQDSEWKIIAEERKKIIEMLEEKIKQFENL